MANDLDAIVALNAALFREDAGQRDPFMDQAWPRREVRAYFAGLLADPDSICYLATADDEPVAEMVPKVRPTSPLRC